MKRYENEDDCFVTDVTLHSKLNELVKVGLLQEHEVYDIGMGKSKYMTYDGNKITITRKVKGRPSFLAKEEKMIFSDFHDVAWCSKTGTMLAFAKAL